MIIKATIYEVDFEPEDHLLVTFTVPKDTYWYAGEYEIREADQISPIETEKSG